MGGSDSYLWWVTVRTAQRAPVPMADHHRPGASTILSWATWVPPLAPDRSPMFTKDAAEPDECPAPADGWAPGAGEGSVGELVCAGVDRLAFEVAVESLGAEFAADAAVLHPAEGRAEVEEVVVPFSRLTSARWRHLPARPGPPRTGA